MDLNFNILIIISGGFLIGIGASFFGLGGGFLIVPLLIFLGYSAQKTAGTAALAILIISSSALIAHNKFSNVDYKTGLLLGLGGLFGAQIGARLLVHVSTDSFRKVFALILVALAVSLFVKK